MAVSCTEAPVFDEFKHVDDAGWHKDSTLKFVVRIDDVSKPYVLSLKMRHNASYPFSNLYMFRKIESATGVEYQDTANLVLADDRGKWLGTGVGELKTMMWAYRNSTIQFKTAGRYTFSLQHGMRTDVLVGVEDIGLEVVPLNSKK